MGNIVLLDDLTINKIAAGEVIERPASVIKELVENSIDAGATNITVEIKNGGISYIRIADNGKGILPDDMEIAFERHATSKIRVAEDLVKVKSMGFRGEALASIAAISKIKMQSKTMDTDTGYQITVEGGKISDKEEIGCQNGTVIEVQDLFYNTPVRYKFLKKDFTESGYIEDVITRIALVHPEIAIKLINTGKTVIQTSGNGDLQTVIYNIYGKDIAENVITVDYEYEDIKVSGVIGKPEIARSNRSNQMFFVNSRYVKDKILTSSAEQAFKEKIPAGKFGFLVLNIEMDPSKVDVNVHPAKLEVRFEEEQKVFKAVYHIIKDELSKGSPVEKRDELAKQNITLSGFEETKTEEKEESISVNSVNDNKSLNVDENVNKYSYKNESETFKTEEPKGLFKKFFSRKEEVVPETTLIEELYNTRRMDLTGNNTDTETKTETETPKFNSILEKMTEMNNTLEEKEEETMQEEIAQEVSEVSDEISSEEVTYDDLEKTQVINTKEIEEQIPNDATQVVDISDIINKDEYGIENENENEDVTETISEDETVTEAKDEEEQEQVNYVEDNHNTFGTKFEDMYSSVFGITPKVEKEEAVEEKEDELPEVELEVCKNVSIFDNSEEKVVPNYKFIGLAFSNYIIIELNKEIYIIDQVTANEKIIYEKIKNAYYNDKEKDSQIMLLPDIIDLTTKEMDVAKENVDMLEKAGFILERFGENTIKLVGVPSICIELDTKDLFIQILNEINKVARTEKEEIEEKFIATIAKNSSMQIKIAESNNEIIDLMDELLCLDNPFVCENGKPVAIKMTKEDIEKKFSRR